MEGVALRKMQEYRKELDAEREKNLAHGRNRADKRKKDAVISDSEDDKVRECEWGND